MVKILIVVFWIATPCSLIHGYLSQSEYWCSAAAVTAQVYTVFSTWQWMTSWDSSLPVSVVLFDPGLIRTSSLFNIYCPTLTENCVHAWCFYGKVTLDGPKVGREFPWWEVHHLYDVLGLQPANVIDGGADNVKMPMKLETLSISVTILDG
jgi:hypothetical protein